MNTRVGVDVNDPDAGHFQCQPIKVEAETIGPQEGR